MKSTQHTDSRSHCLLAALLTCTVSMGASADDIDVYKAHIASQQKPNILFVLDYSFSMTYNASGPRRPPNGPTRLEVLRDAMNKLVDNNVDNINAGLGSFFQAESTGIRWPISDLSADASTIDPDIPPNQFTVADIIKQRVANRETDYQTATVDALVEAAQYFRGDPVTHNDTPPTNLDGHRPPRWNATTQRYEGTDLDVSVASAYSPANAYSDDLSQTFYCNDYTGSGGPNFCEEQIVSACESVTAEDPVTEGYEYTNNLWGDYQRCEYSRTENWVTPRFNSPIGDTCEAQENAIVMITDGLPTKYKQGDSLRSLVGDDLSVCEDLSTTILASRPARWRGAGNCAIEIVRSLATEPVNPSLPNTFVKTYTVGFNTDEVGQVFLGRLADEGDGEFYLAENPEELNLALTAAIQDITDSSQNFSELSVDVDKATFSHNDRAYYSLFSPSKRRAWQGNLKGYFIEPTGLVDINGVAATLDNEFVPTAQSFWSEAADGSTVSSGGASEQMILGNRNLYTFVGDALPEGGVDFANRDDVYLDRTNSSITNAALGLGTSASDNQERDTALDWIQTAPMGDPLHTKSVSVNYADKQVVYIMTNQGFLHAIDATKPAQKDVGDNTGGEELFAFMPKSLLGNLPEMYRNPIGDDIIYGLDGPLTRWHNDTDNNGIVNNGESVMLYFGMRRGGSEYYAMDVSDPETPVLKWVIDQDTEGFESLAQSWSRMSMIRVSHDGDKKRVLAFAAGYDAAAQDNVDTPVSSKGNAIYMVDENGTLLWTVDSDDHNDMDYSIASDLTLIDSDGDQLADRLYVGDLAGQLWRVDFEDIDDTPAVTKLASLGDDDHQPFFYPPSVAINGESGSRFLSVTIGSGNRTNPLLTDVQNNFYMIRDEDVLKGPPEESTYPTVTIDDLYDATDNDVQSSDNDEAQEARESLETSRGWRIRLADGEKSLSRVLTYEGRVLATTYSADSSSAVDQCNFASTGKFFVMDVVDASIPLGTSNETTEETPGERGQNLTTGGGIPSAPTPVITKDSNSVQIFVDKEPVDEFPRRLSNVYWHAR